ncbi:unnamed protein product, partial [marine sediment metagenome]
FHKLGLGKIKGIGPKKRKKLIDGGIESVLDLAASLPKEIEEVLGGKEKSANSLISYARQYLISKGLLEKEFVPANEVLQRRRAMKKITTGSKNLDELLLGGVETQSITEFFGDFGSGKTQICHTLCATCQLPSDQGGLDGGVIYVDTEGTFRPERLYQICETRGLDTDEILQKVILCTVYNSSHLELVIKGLGRFIE